MKLKMHRVLAFMLTLAMLVSLVTISVGAEEPVLLSEDFEAGEEMPSGWTTESALSGFEWIIGSGYSSGSTGAASGDFNALVTHRSTGAVSWLVTPEIDLTGEGDYAKIDFYLINKAWMGDIDTFVIACRVDGGDWVEFFRTADSHEEWTQLSAAIPLDFVGETVQIGFGMIDGFGYGIGLDDIEIAFVEATSLTLKYDPNGGTGEVIETEVLEGYPEIVADNTFTAPDGLTFSSWNTAEDGSGERYYPGASIAVTADTTLYAQWIDKFSISEGFESGTIPDGWTQVTERENLVWTVGVGDYSASTGTHSGNYNALLKTDDEGDTAWLITPELDLSSRLSGSLSFWYINRAWQGDIDLFGVYYRIDGGEWVELFYTEDSHGTWTHVFIQLDDDQFQDKIQFGFMGTEGYGYGIGLDDVELMTSVNPLPAADMFNVSLPEGTLIADGTDYAEQVSVTVKSEYEELIGAYGAKLWYYDIETVDSAVSVGIYNVAIVVSEGEGFAAAVLTDPEWSFIVAYDGYFNDFDDEENDPIADWTFADLDGDGYNWFVYSSAGVLTSASYYNNSAIEPDNLAFMPPVLIPENGILNFLLYAQDPNYPGDKVAVYIGDDTDFDNMEFLGDYIAESDVVSYDIDLGEYAGKVKLIAFRHYDSYDFFRCNIDDVSVLSHVHNFTYTADGNTITAQCNNDGCPNPDGYTLVLNAPYDFANGFFEATLAGYSSFVFPGEYTLTYSGRNGTEYEESTVAPTAQGDYTATLTICGVTVSVDYTIAKYHVYVAENIKHGTVSVEKTEAYEDEAVYLYNTPDPGYEWDHYVITYDGVDYDFVYQGVLMPDGDITVGAVFTRIAYPEFIGHSLVLSGQIGLKFRMDLSALTESELDDSYMIFTVNGKETRVDTADANVLDDGTYVFTCFVNSLQMAECVDAVFNFAGDEYVANMYSVRDYIEYILADVDDFSKETVNLAIALADYGHYAQIYLTKVNNIPEGKYAEMDVYETEEFDIDDVKANVEDYTLDLDKGDSSVIAAAMRLTLDSETALSVRLQVPTGTELTATATFNGKTFTAKKLTDEYYIITIKGITSAQYADEITITGSADGDFTVSVSALAYVNAALSADVVDDDAANTVAALYNYYVATVEYRDAQ